MRQAGDILLLSTYELGHQPFLLASPAAFLRRAGFAPALGDLSVDALDEDAVRRAKFIGISVPMHTALRLGTELAERIRKLNSAAHICMYGLYAHLNRDYLRRWADSVLAGELERALVEVLHTVEHGSSDAKTQAVPNLERLDFVAADRTGLPPLQRYAKLIRGSEHSLAGYTEASRGCLHLCRHCPIVPVYGGRFFVLPVEVVVEDVARQVAEGAKHITLGDPDFWNGPGHALRVLEALHTRFPTLTFDVTIKIEHLLKHRAHLPDLARLGVLFIVSAVESLAPRVLEILDKGHSAADVDEALTLTRAQGLTLRPSLVPFTPFSTLDDYFALLEWIARQGLTDEVDPVQLGIRLLIPPGSRLLELDEVRAAIGPLDAENLSYRWTHPDARMDALAEAVLNAVAHGATLPDIVALAEAARDGRPLVYQKPSKHLPVLSTSPRLSESWFCCAEPVHRR